MLGSIPNNRNLDTPQYFAQSVHPGLVPFHAGTICFSLVSHQTVPQPHRSGKGCQTLNHQHRRVLDSSQFCNIAQPCATALSFSVQPKSLTAVELDSSGKFETWTPNFPGVFFTSSKEISQYLPPCLSALSKHVLPNGWHLSEPLTVSSQEALSWSSSISPC